MAGRGQVAPSIIFIDGLDAVDRARGGAFSAGGVDEREQTLNQIFTEMVEFQGNEGVVVLAATNRPEILDPALLRPGRFDRRVSVNPPDFGGRLQIVRVHTRTVPLAPEVDLAAVAAAPGLVGADLANLVNEAAPAAAQHGHETVTGTDLGEAVEKVLLGTVRGIALSPEEKLSTAYHESGHALPGMLTPGADPVRRVTIIPRGQSPETRQLLDAEIRRLVVDCYGEAVATLRSNRDRLDRLAHTLLERETLGEDEAYAAAGVTPASAPADVARGEAPGSDRVPGMPPEDVAVPTG